MEHILVVDAGTSSLRAMLYNGAGRLLCRAGREYHPEFAANSYVEQDPATWEEALLFALRQAGDFIRAQNIRLEAIAVTSQRASVIPVGGDSRPLFKAIMWQDRRSIAQCDKLLAQAGLNDIYRRTGLRVNPYFSAPKMMWLKEARPDLYAAAQKLVGVQDYIVYLLTGSYITDWTQASRTMLMNIESFTWDQDMLRLCGLEAAKLPALVPPGAAVGLLTRAMAEATGLKPGTPVILGGGDQQCAALALNILQPGYAEANTGTGSFVIAYAEKPQFDAACRTLCSAAAIPGKWVLEAGIFNTGAVYRWFREQFYPGIEGDQDTYTIMNQEAAASPVGANGVMMLSHFEGSAAPYWNPLAKGLFFNLSLGTRRGDLARAILEGIALEIAHNISLIENLAPPISVVSVAGGLAAFDLFNRIQADAFNKTVLRYDNSEASSLGALLSALVSLGICRDYAAAFRAVCPAAPAAFKPDAANAEKYRILFERKNALYQALNQQQIYQLFSAPV